MPVPLWFVHGILTGACACGLAIPLLYLTDRDALIFLIAAATGMALLSTVTTYIIISRFHNALCEELQRVKKMEDLPVAVRHIVHKLTPLAKVRESRTLTKHLTAALARLSHQHTQEMMRKASDHSVSYLPMRTTSQEQIYHKHHHSTTSPATVVLGGNVGLSPPNTTADGVPIASPSYATSNHKNSSHAGNMSITEPYMDTTCASDVAILHHTSNNNPILAATSQINFPNMENQMMYHRVYSGGSSPRGEDDAQSMQSLLHEEYLGGKSANNANNTDARSLHTAQSTGNLSRVRSGMGSAMTAQSRATASSPLTAAQHPPAVFRMPKRFHHDNPNIVFYIERNKNFNLVVFQAKYMEEGDPTSFAGLDCFWLKIDPQTQSSAREQGIEQDRMELSDAERRTTYSYTFDGEEGSLRLRLLPDRVLALRQHTTTQLPILVGMIHKRECIYERMYLKQHEEQIQKPTASNGGGDLASPRIIVVEEADVFGYDVISGQSVSEHIVYKHNNNTVRSPTK